MRRARRLLLLALLTAPLLAAAAPRASAYRFGIIGHSFIHGGEEQLRQSLRETGEKGLAFVVVTGIKGSAESCGDRLYQKRRDIIARARQAVIVAPAGSDWTECRNSGGHSDAIERLARLRELFFAEPYSLGAVRLPLARQSMSPRFRSYAENAHWEMGKVLYATVNLPADNNHYIAAAGRNSEYEDRLVANRFWLNRLFALARGEKAEAIVLFSEGDLKALSEPTGLRALLRPAPAPNDGFYETRRLVLSLSKSFRGKVLLVDSAEPAKGARAAIEWRDNVGHLTAGPGVLEVRVDPGSKALFSVKKDGAAAR